MMSSVRCLIHVRSSFAALGSKILPLNQFKTLYPSTVNGIHTLISDRGPLSKTLHEKFLLISTPQFPTSLECRRWETTSSDPPECNHWSRQWERDRLAKKRFSNEGRELRSLFTRRTAAELWKGVTSQSNAAAKSGRGKRGKKLRRVDLNRGQVRGRDITATV